MKILVSACLLGHKVRYDGKDSAQNNPTLKKWEQENKLVPICPEMAGGLPTPRPPCEIVGGRVISINGEDKTKEFQLGAQKALELCQKHKIKLAVLKANSPSCGNCQIYDGTFQNRKIKGQGVTAALLSQNGIKVLNETEISLGNI